TEVTTPAPQVSGEILYHPRETHPSAPTRQFPHPLLEPRNDRRRDASLGLSCDREAKAKERSLRRPSHGTLRAVDLEFESACDEGREALHHSLPRALATHVDIAVIGVANEPVAASLQLSIELVEHQVAQQRR